MDLSGSGRMQESIADVISSVVGKNVRLWSENGELRYRAPKGALTAQEIERLRSRKDEIVALLETATRAQNVAPRLGPRVHPDRAPLTYAQLAYWRSCRLSERASVRGVASVTHLKGRMKFDALQKAALEVIRRHEALRTRIVVVEGAPEQQIDEVVTFRLELKDLTRLSCDLRTSELKRLIKEFLLQPVDVSSDPLFGMRLFRLCDDEHVLVLAMEHVISDGFSLRVLLRDLLAIYTQVLKGGVSLLPPLIMQPADYALWQRSAESSWLEKHAKYWQRRMAGCQRLRFPGPEDSQKAQPCSEFAPGVVPLRISADLMAELSQWCRRRRTTVVMAVFTAYVAALMRWCNVSDAVIKFQTDSRSSPQLEQLICYVASRLHLRITLCERDTFIDLLKLVVAEYCAAHEHGDFSYLEAQEPRPDWTRNPLFNWIPRGSMLQIAELNESEHALTCVQHPFEYPAITNAEFDGEPRTVLAETDDGAVGYVRFPPSRFSSETMGRFRRNFILFLEVLLKEPERQISSVALCR
jgi:hypothetical protein